ncbi:hypothetical protein [Flavilitoribacter nigricans]|uniref:Dockerin domain-containing protein n=1 Tax=Flavilitoribacter nigricans (strain ATCC 23147 / DSM 23189 / NBRC 102662 / NCIMB 1420 / SS-2) TaxID=1122177 RepID=A0A2D0NFY1_FLAN2|nr:hypothetical protein [Flavilitoribacter nigricans]PHN07286.1 hypothetical protein CRP01_06555 [Flavilitoribacter nigricans DSM 23189 = NBRC 102662]
MMNFFTRRTALFLWTCVFSALPFSAVFACSCSFSPDTFCESINEDHQLVLASFISSDGGPNAHYRVVEGINNDLTGDTILVLGHDGANCLEEVLYGMFSDTILLALNGGNAATYAWSACGVFYAFYERDSLSFGGWSYPEQEKTAYTDFLANLSECQQLSEYMPGTGRIVDWRDTTSGLAAFRFQINDLSLITDGEGRYYFQQIPFRPEYWEPHAGTPLAPRSDADILQSVTTADLIRMQKHILGLTPFSHPEQYLAADVDNSRHVSVMDVLLLRRIILNLTTNFPGGQSWRFIPLDYEFPDPNNPWAEDFPEAIWISYRTDFDDNLVYRKDDLHFRAIKIGDL